MPAHQFTLLQAFPWLNGMLLEKGGVGELRGSTALHSYGESVAAIIDKLSLFEADKKLQEPFKSVLFAQPHSLIESRLANLSAFNADKISNLATFLLDYRFLDVAISLQVGELPAGQSSRLPIPLPPKMFFKNTADWCSVVSTGLQLIKDCEDVQPLPYDHSLNSTLSIFSSLLHRKEKVDGHKIMSNFECAAAHLSLILRGIVDLPNTLEDFKSLVLGLCRDGSESTLPADRWEAFFASLKSPHSFKLPLHIALSCSPICLLLPTCIMTKDLNRLVLLQIWQGLGGCRPETFKSIDYILWRALFESASGMAPLHARLMAAFQSIALIDLSQVGFPASEWLAGDPGFIGMQPRLLLSKNPRPNSSRSLPRNRSAATQSVTQAQLHPHSSSESKADNATAPGRMTRSTKANTESQALSSRTAGSASTSREGRVPSRTPGRNRSAAGRGGAKGKARAVPEPSSSDNTEDDDEDYSGDKPTIRKRTRSTMSTTNTAGPEPSVKALKLEDGGRVVRVYEAIDLTSEAVGPPVVDLTLDDDEPEERFQSTVCVLWDWRSSMDHIAKFYFRREAEWFTALFRAIRGCRPGESPQFYADKDASFFTVLDGIGAEDLPVDDMQGIFHQRAIVMTQGSVGGCLFNSRSVRTFCLLEKVISIRDFSISPDEDRMTTGTLAQLLASAHSDSKILAAPDVPIPGGAAPLSSLASDTHAWDMTIDQAWCSRRWEMPRSAVRWAEISTRSAYRPLSLSPNGFATQIEVKAGSQLLVVCQPSIFNPHAMTSITTLDQVRNPYLPDTKTFDFQMIHLRAGYIAVIKPLTPFLLLSTENSIVQMSHFYAMSTMQATCVGFIHSALTMSSATNPAQKASQSLLRRMVHYLHLVYTSQDYLTCQKNYPHAPDILTSEGVIDVLSLCNVFEMMNVLAYTVTDLERHLFVEARRLCRRIVAWMQGRFTFTDHQQARRLKVLEDIWMPYLSLQVKALQAYQELLQKRGMNSVDHAAFRIKLDAFEKNHRMLAKVAQRTLGPPEDFRWPRQSTFTVSLRLSPDRIPDDIRGELHDDLLHFGV